MRLLLASLVMAFSLAFSVACLPAVAAEGDAAWISVPKSVAIGEPFLVSAGGEGVNRVIVRWMGKTLELVPGTNGQPQGACAALLPVSLKETKKRLPLAVSVFRNGKEEKKNYSITIVQKEYPVQRLNVAPKYVTPPASEKERIKRDRQQINDAISVVSPVRHWQYRFDRPVPGEITSEFGLRREFNGQKRNPHMGLDLDGEKGDPIVAAESGTVVLVGDFYYGGNTVIIDHGLGVFTLYLHLNDFAVSKGQKVSRGATIGFVGSTGRVTGPHLHLSVNVLGQSVNPSAVLEPYPGQ